MHCVCTSNRIPESQHSPSNVTHGSEKGLEKLWRVRYEMLVVLVYGEDGEDCVLADEGMAVFLRVSRVMTA